MAVVIDGTSGITTPGVSSSANIVMTAGGITFNANPGGGTQATLNDYEVGTWTPNVGGNATYTLQAGTYVKVGSMVVVSFAMAINVIGTGSTTNIFGFPFLCVSITGIYPTGSIAYFSALNASVTSIVTQMQVNTTNCTFATTSAATTQITNTASVFKSGTNMYGTITYQSTN